MARKPSVRMDFADNEEDLPPPEAYAPISAALASANTPKPTPEPSDPPAPAEPPPPPAAKATTSVPQVKPIRYESRIRILEAWQYPGNVLNAPDFIDRNWIGWANDDTLRNIPAGPVLRVPLDPGPSGNPARGIVRIGDFVVRQEVVLLHGAPPSVRIEVWTREDFERIFVPVASSAPYPGDFPHELEGAPV